MLSIRSDIRYKLQSNITQLLLEDGNINSKESGMQGSSAYLEEIRTCRCFYRSKTGNWSYNSHWQIKVHLEDWKNIFWSNERLILLQQSDSRVTIWWKQHVIIAPSCIGSTVKDSFGVIEWGIFSWLTLGPLVSTEHCLNTTAHCF